MSHNPIMQKNMCFIYYVDTNEQFIQLNCDEEKTKK